VSLSHEPVHGLLRENFVCAIKDITGESYSGKSGIHKTYANAVQTTNGAGPRNIQLFVLSPDGVVLHCLPGYWSSRDLSYELKFAQQLGVVWQDQGLSRQQKDQKFKELHLAHINEHPPQMSWRSHMQGFDQQYEAEHNLQRSDVIKDRRAVARALEEGWDHVPGSAFKTTDQIVHERLASRPFMLYDRFDVATFAAYGKPYYDKHEDERDAHLARIEAESRMNRRMHERRQHTKSGYGSTVRNYRW